MDTIKVGVIANTHGLQGELKVKSFSDFNDTRYHVGNVLLMLYKEDWIKVEIKTYREYKDMVLLTLQGMEDINEVEKYKGCELHIPCDELHSLDVDEVYFYQLMGCEVYTLESEFVGVVEDVFETGANAVLRVSKTILIPYVKAFIIECDIKNKKIVIQNIEGLL